MHDVKISRKGKTQIIQMMRPPGVGKYITVAGQQWLVCSVTIEVPFRTRKARKRNVA